jgi:hypothetical protein
MPRFFHFDSANTILNCGNTSPNKEGGPFSDTGDIIKFNKEAIR